MREHIRFATQPFEDPEPAGALTAVLDGMDAEQTLMFSSDFPHWDFDPPDAIVRRLPESLRQRVLVETALETYPKLPR